VSKNKPKKKETKKKINKKKRLARLIEYKRERDNSNLI